MIASFALIAFPFFQLPDFGGRFEYHVFHFPGVTANDSKLRRFRFNREGQWSKNFGYELELELSDGAKFENGNVHWISRHGMKVQAGLLKEPLGHDTFTSSRFMTFTERNIVSDLTPSDNTGIMVEYGNSAFTWHFGAFGKVAHGGMADKEDALTGRLVWRPWYQDSGKLLHLGLSTSLRNPQRNEVSWGLDGGPSVMEDIVNTGILAADALHCVGTEVAWMDGQWSLLAETMTVSIRGGEGGSAQGWSLQGSCFLTGEHRNYKISNGTFGRTHPYSSFLENGNGALELAARTERVLFPSTSLSAGMGVQTLALNWWLTPYWRIQTGWDHLQPVGGEGVQAWTIRFACDW